MKTEDQFYYDHLDSVLSVLYKRMDELETYGTLTDQDEMELSSLDRLTRDIGGL